MKNDKAKEWDRIYKENKLEDIPWHNPKPDKNIIKELKKGTIQKGFVLDMCSGEGTNSRYLASRGFEVMGVDISRTAVELAKEKCKKRNLSCEYTAGDVLAIKTNKKFEFIFDRGCFHHITKEDKPRYVKKVHNLLNNKGKLYIQCFSDKNKEFQKSLTKEDIKNYFSDKFNIIYIKDSVHKEPDTKETIYLYSVFMEKKNS
jgi:cyclopropane fatty-acyl-phospholipid synthase-like methyltransferase